MPHNLDEPARSIQALENFARAQPRQRESLNLSLSNETGLPLAVEIRYNEVGNTLTIHVVNRAP